MRRICAAALCAASVSLAAAVPATAADPISTSTPSPDATGTVLVGRKASSGRWSDPATWGGTLPKQGQNVTIPYGTKVVLDSSPPPLGGLRVDGVLTFARKELELSAEWIMVHGKFRIGTPAKPFTHRAVITLTGAGDTNVMDMGTRFLGVMGGTLDLHGRRIKGWTNLDATATKGDRRISLSRKMGWKPTDKIVIASSSYWNEHYEEATIASVEGNELELTAPLARRHWGELQEYGGRVVDERAEVGLLSRNILIRGAGAGLADGFGGHLMIMEGGRARIQGVELANMGQRNLLRRYPVHFHMGGSAKDSYLKTSSIHHSFNRCVVVHGTDGVRIRNNVCFDHVGHGFFLEDGAETGNALVGNLGLGTRSVEKGLLPSDRRAATFWITNPDNVVRDNVAAGSDGFGFWYALPEHPTGPSETSSIWPRRTPLKSFKGNVAHSNGDSGLNVDHGPRPNGNTEATWYRPVKDPSDPDSQPVVARFEDFTAYFNRDRGVWLRGENHVVSGAILADNRSGATFASSETFLKDSLVVGETANPGTTESWEEQGHDGRALPFFWEPAAQIIGFEFYDGRVGVETTTFAGFKTNPVRPAGALGYLARNAFGIHPRNFARAVEFVDSTPVYLAPVVAGMDGDASKVFQDVDGSVTGTPGRTVVVDNSFLLPSGCTFRSNWNAHVCNADHVSLMVGTQTGDPASVKPVRITRADGTEQRLMGCCEDSTEAWTSILADDSYEVRFSGGTPDKTRFVLRGKGKWLTLTLALPAGSKVTRWGYSIKSVASMSALSSATDSASFHDGTHLHIKLVGNGDWEELRVQRP